MTKKRLRKIYNAVVPLMLIELREKHKACDTYAEKYLFNYYSNQLKSVYKNFNSWYDSHKVEYGKCYTNDELYYEHLCAGQCIYCNGDKELFYKYVLRKYA